MLIVLLLLLFVLVEEDNVVLGSGGRRGCGFGLGRFDFELEEALESPLRSAAVHHFGGCGDGVDLCFDDVIYGFWVYYWVFSRVY